MDKDAAPEGATVSAPLKVTGLGSFQAGDRTINLRASVVLGRSPEMRALFEAGALRMTMLVPLSERGLPSDWAVPIEPGEVVLATVPAGRYGSAPGVAALIAKADALPRPEVNEAFKARMAAVLADLLTEETK